MKKLINTVLVTIAMTSLWMMDFSPEMPFVPVFVGDAGAVVGRPLTPVSVGGVARRTTRRAVYATSATNTAAQQEAAAQPQAAANPLPKGTVVTALPSGCQSTTVDGISLFNCGGTMYKPTFQSNNLVYVVQ